jgi:hypothetical protein
MRKRLLVLLMAAFMVVMSAAPAMAVEGQLPDPEKCEIKENPQGNRGDIPCRKGPAGNQVDDGADHDQGGGNDHIKTNMGKGNG